MLAWLKFMAFADGAPENGCAAGRNWVYMSRRRGSSMPVICGIMPVACGITPVAWGIMPVVCGIIPVPWGIMPVPCGTIGEPNPVGWPISGVPNFVG